MRYHLFLLILLQSLPSFAQLSVGSQGMRIQANTGLRIDGLSLTPSIELTVANNAIQRSGTAIAGGPHGSINRVYSFAAVIPFSGTAGIAYQTTELAGNAESDLQLAYQSAPGGGYTTTANSVVDASRHYVSTSFAGQNLFTLTATSRNTALPVTLINFLASNDNGDARLNWTTAQEHNTDRFSIECSADIERWQTVGSVQASGESSITASYQFRHPGLVEGANYYRLKIIDKDAAYAYSPIRSVTIETLDKPLLYPNPAHDRLQVRGASKKEVQRVSIYDMAGKLVETLGELPLEGVNISGLPAGSYLLQVQWQGAAPWSRAFIKE